MPLTLAEHERKIINYTEHVAGGQNHPLLQARLVMALADYFHSPLPHPPVSGSLRRATFVENKIKGNC